MQSLPQPAAQRGAFQSRNNAEVARNRGTGDARRVRNQHTDIYLHFREELPMNQNQIILNHLNEYGTISPKVAFEVYGIMRLAARIADLRKLGYDIISKRTTFLTRTGEKGYYSEYELMERPR